MPLTQAGPVSSHLLTLSLSHFRTPPASPPSSPPHRPPMHFLAGLDAVHHPQTGDRHRRDRPQARQEPTGRILEPTRGYGPREKANRHRQQDERPRTACDGIHRHRQKKPPAQTRRAPHAPRPAVEAHNHLAEFPAHAACPHQCPFLRQPGRLHEQVIRFTDPVEMPAGDFIPAGLIRVETLSQPVVGPLDLRSRRGIG